MVEQFGGRVLPKFREGLIRATFPKSIAKCWAETWFYASVINWIRDVGIALKNEGKIVEGWGLSW